MATKSLCQYNRYSLSLSSKFSSPITAFILIRCDHLFHLLRIITTDLVRIVQRRRTSDDTRRGGTWIPIFPSATGIQSIQSQQSIVPHDTSQRCWPTVRRPFPPVAVCARIYSLHFNLENKITTIPHTTSRSIVYILSFILYIPHTREFRIISNSVQSKKSHFHHGLFQSSDVLRCCGCGVQCCVLGVSSLPSCLLRWKDSMTPNSNTLCFDLQYIQ